MCGWGQSAGKTGSGRNPQRLDAWLPPGMKLQSELHGDVQRPAETTGPPVKAGSNNADSATYDPTGAVAAADIGIAEKGYELSLRYLKEMIGDTDAYGDTPIDAIYRGAEMFLQSTLKEYKASVLNAVLPYQSVAAGAFVAFAPTGVNSFQLGVIGRLDTDLDGIVIMTSTTGTPAVATPATATFTHCMFAANFDLRMLFGPTLRKVPFRWQVYPYLDTTIKFFTTA